MRDREPLKILYCSLDFIDNPVEAFARRCRRYIDAHQMSIDEGRHIGLSLYSGPFFAPGGGIRVHLDSFPIKLCDRSQLSPIHNPVRALHPEGGWPFAWLVVKLSNTLILQYVANRQSRAIVKLEGVLLGAPVDYHHPISP